MVSIVNFQIESDPLSDFPLKSFLFILVFHFVTEFMFFIWSKYTIGFKRLLSELF